MRKRWTAASVFVAIFALLAPAAPAQATGHSYSMTTSIAGGKVWFYPHGDHVYLCDQKPGDNRMAELHIWNVTRDPNWYEYRLRDLYDRDLWCAEGHARWGQPWNMAEKHCFRFRIRLRDLGTNKVVPGSTHIVQWRNYPYKKSCPGVT